MRTIILLGLLCSFLSAEPREALLIGNHSYQYITNLDDPSYNLGRLKESLKSLDFKVRVEPNLNSENLENAIEEFKNRLARNTNTIGFLYYTGHGCQVDYQGYLVPTNVDTQKKLKIKYNALNINKMLETLKEAGNKVNLLFLDACRDVPTGSKGGTKGLGQPTQKPRGTMLVYATEAGKVANDNAKFINALIENINKPNQYIKDIGDNISLIVAQQSNYHQIPEVYSKLLPKMMLKGGYVPLKPRVVPIEPVYVPQPELVVVKPKIHSTKNTVTIDGLMYQNQLFTKEDANNLGVRSKGRVQNWSGAIQYCKDLTLGSYSDWRLPKKSELRKLLTKTQHRTASGDKLYIRAEFAKKFQKYGWAWSSTEKDSSLAWGVGFYDGNGSWNFKTNNYYALCVR